MHPDQHFNYGADFLTATQALAITRGNLSGVLNSEIRQRVNQSSAYVEKIAKSDKTVYGINTGFGPLCTTRISAEDTRKLQENILKSHAVGVGEFIDVELSKLMLVLKVHALAKGFQAYRSKRSIG